MNKYSVEKSVDISGKCIESDEKRIDMNKIIPLGNSDKKNSHLQRSINRAAPKDFEDSEYLLPLYNETRRGITIFDLKDRVININDSFLNITGFKKDELSETTLGDLLKRISGKDINSDFFASGKQLQTNIFNWGKNHIISALIHILPVFNKDGSLTGKAIILEPFQYTKKEKIEHNERSNKLKAMGEISGAMAHEVRNPLGSIELFASMIKSGMLESAEIVKFTDHILTSVKKLECLISNLMIFSNPQAPFFTKIDGNSMLADFLNSIEFLLEQNNINLVKKFPQERIFFHADAELLKQALLNLLLNSIQSMPEGGSISINTYSVYDLSDYPEGAFVISLSDTGCGIPCESFEKIFLPFFSTKEKKAGIGLSIVNNIIEAHRGHIEVSSTIKEETVFRVFFPICTEEVSE